jgi:hypothetical protein
MNVSNLLCITSFLSSLNLVLIMVGISSLLSAVTLLILTISHLKHKSRSALPLKSHNKVAQPDFPASV